MKERNLLEGGRVVKFMINYEGLNIKVDPGGVFMCGTW